MNSLLFFIWACSPSYLLHSAPPSTGPSYHELPPLLLDCVLWLVFSTHLCYLSTSEFPFPLASCDGLALVCASPLLCCWPRLWKTSIILGFFFLCSHIQFDFSKWSLLKSVLFIEVKFFLVLCPDFTITNMRSMRNSLICERLWSCQVGVWMWIWMHTFMHTHMHTHTCTHTHAYTHAHTHTHAHTQTHNTHPIHNYFLFLLESCHFQPLI
jgi:hypothetical protein